MITVRRGKETTEVDLEGVMTELILESFSVVKSISMQIIERADNPEEAIYHYVNDLIDAVYDK